MYNNKCKGVKEMIKNLIKELILKQCEMLEITPKEAMQIDITAIVTVTIIALSIRPFFELVAEIIQL